MLIADGMRLAARENAAGFGTVGREGASLQAEALGLLRKLVPDAGWSSAMQDAHPGQAKLVSGALDKLSRGHDGRVSESQFREAFSLASGQEVMEQLGRWRVASATLAGSRIDRINHDGSPLHFAQPTPADLTLANGESAGAYFHVVGPQGADAPWMHVDVPVQIISANLFHTVPASAQRDMTFSPELFKPGLWDDTIRRWSSDSKPSILKTQLEAMWRREPVTMRLSEHAGPSVAKVFDGDWGSSPNMIQQALRSEPFARSLKETLVEREVLGDADCNIGNVTVRVPPSANVAEINFDRAKLANVDLDYALHPRFGSVPMLRKIFNDPALVGLPLHPEMPTRLGRFVDNYGSSRGQTLLFDLGAQAPRVNEVLTRAQWFVDHKTLPT